MKKLFILNLILSTNCLAENNFTEKYCLSEFGYYDNIAPCGTNNCFARPEFIIEEIREFDNRPGNENNPHKLLSEFDLTELLMCIQLRFACSSSDTFDTEIIYNDCLGG
jgi:hypothetical protein